MRPVLVAWLRAHGLPEVFAPDYAVMCGLASIFGAIILLKLARRDGEKVHIQARALALAYVAALLGGYVFEWVRAVPDAIAARSLEPIVTTGRAAYGGLLAGIVAPALYLRFRARRDRAPNPWLSARAFLDRATPGMGIAFALVRVGCFLEGCDYGKPTGGPLGVRFPVGSLAARDHFAHGWIPINASSLPVHATELYESGVGVLASILAWRWLRQGRRDGTAFLVWIAAYAAGRFAIELLRGDADRGLYVGLSSAQLVSLTLVAVAFVLARRWKLPLFERASAPRGPSLAPLVLAFVAFTSAYFVELGVAKAQPASAAPTDTVILKTGERLTGTVLEDVSGQYVNIRLQDGRTALVVWSEIDRVERGGTASPPPTVPTPPTPATPAPAVTPATPAPIPPAPEKLDDHSVQSERRLTVRVAVASSLTLARPDVPSGTAYELDALVRFRLGERARAELGLEGRLLENDIARHYGMGVAGQLVLELGRHFEMGAIFVPTHTWIDFGTSSFSDTNVWGLRMAGEMAWVVSSRVTFAFSPLALNVLSHESIGVITSYEPRISFGLAF